MFTGCKAQQQPADIHAPWALVQPAELTANADIALIGGGIASVFSALSLLERGAKVTVYCEDNSLAANASGNKQGAFYPQLSDDDLRYIRFYIHAFAYGKQRFNWAIEQGITFEHDFCGVALCAYDAKSAVKLAKISALQLPLACISPYHNKHLANKSGYHYHVMVALSHKALGYHHNNLFKILSIF